MGLIEAIRRIVDEARPAISGPPRDCSNACLDGPCDCSGERVVIGWDIDVPKLREMLEEVEEDTVGRLRQALWLCGSAAGNPDAADGCRRVIQIVKQSLTRRKDIPCG